MSGKGISEIRSAFCDLRADLMFWKKDFIFTVREHPIKAIMAAILGILAIATLGTAVYLSYLSGGQVTDRHGTAALLAVVFMSAGMVLGILSFVEKDKFRLFPVLGILLNTLAFGMLSLILYAGAYVDV